MNHDQTIETAGWETLESDSHLYSCSKNLSFHKSPSYIFHIWWYTDLSFFSLCTISEYIILHLFIYLYKSIYIFLAHYILLLYMVFTCSKIIWYGSVTIIIQLFFTGKFIKPLKCSLIFFFTLRKWKPSIL